MPLTSTESWKGVGGTPAPHLCFRSSPLTTALQRLSNNDTGSRSWDSPDPQCAWLYGHPCTDGIYGPRAQERHHHPIGCYLLYLEWIPGFFGKKTFLDLSTVSPMLFVRSQGRCSDLPLHYTNDGSETEVYPLVRRPGSSMLLYHQGLIASYPPQVVISSTYVQCYLMTFLWQEAQINTYVRKLNVNPK